MRSEKSRARLATPRRAGRGRRARPSARARCSASRRRRRTAPSRAGPSRAGPSGPAATEARRVRAPNRSPRARRGRMAPRRAGRSPGWRTTTTASFSTKARSRRSRRRVWIATSRLRRTSGTSAGRGPRRGAWSAPRRGASSIASRAARLSRRPPRTTRRRTRTRSLRTSSRLISCTGTGRTTAATTWRTTWTGSSSTPPPPSACATTPKSTRSSFSPRTPTTFYAWRCTPTARSSLPARQAPIPASASGPARRVSCSRSSKGSTEEPWSPCPSTAPGGF